MSYSACNIWKAHVYSQVLKLFIWSVWGENIQETNNLPTKIHQLISELKQWNEPVTVKATTLPSLLAWWLIY